jgi:hypothetical protein
MVNSYGAGTQSGPLKMGKTQEYIKLTIWKEHLTLTLNTLVVSFFNKVII